jgi:hypothetical protein
MATFLYIINASMGVSFILLGLVGLTAVVYAVTTVAPTTTTATVCPEVPNWLCFPVADATYVSEEYPTSNYHTAVLAGSSALGKFSGAAYDTILTWDPLSLRNPGQVALSAKLQLAQAYISETLLDAKLQVVELALDSDLFDTATCTYSTSNGVNNWDPILETYASADNSANTSVVIGDGAPFNATMPVALVQRWLDGTTTHPIAVIVRLTSEAHVNYLLSIAAIGQSVLLIEYTAATTQLSDPPSTTTPTTISLADSPTTTEVVDTTEAPKKKSNAALVIGVSVAAGVVFLAGVAGGVYFKYFRKPAVEYTQIIYH